VNPSQSLPRRPGPAAELLAELCDALAARPEFRDNDALLALADMASQCRQPLRVAVTGDVSTGKSTLVNALLGQERAKVSRRETTANVTWYRHPALSPGPSLGPGHKYEAAPFRLAERVILADTPGVNTSSPHEQVTDAMLKGASTAVGSATVLLYLCHKTVSAGAKERVDQFSRLTAGELGRGFNVVLVGAKADEGGIEPAEIRANLELEAGMLGAQVVTVAQQLGVVARTTSVQPEHLKTLRIIARDRELRQDYAPNGWDMLRLGWRLRERDANEINALWNLTPTTFGVVRSLSAIDSGKIACTADLVSFWEDLSGLAALETLLERLADDADVLTVNAVSGRLRRLGARLGPARALMIRERLDGLRDHPQFAQLELRAAALVLETCLFSDVTEQERREAIDLLREPPPRVGAPELARRWRRRAALPGRSTFARRVAEIVADTALSG
jgi:hypothetical protein